MINVLKQLKIDFRIRLGYGAAFVLLLISYILTWYANQQLIAQSKWVLHSNIVITHMEDLASHIKDAETGVRGFILMKDESFLAPYNASKALVEKTFNELKEETKDNTSQQILLYTVKGYIDKKYDILNSSREMYKSKPFVLSDSIKRKSYEGKHLMDSIRTTIAEMKTKEQEILASRTRELSARYVSMNIIIITSLILAFLFAALGFITYTRENKARKVSDQKVMEYQEQLKKRIEELDVANKELIQMRSTEKFAATGRMARTMAHEVRNPLTNIDLAISQLKSELPAADESANMLFEMVQRNSKRINQLITELLAATRFVDLSFQRTSINTILDETMEQAQDRIELNRIKLVKQYGKNMCDISVDVGKIKIALLNLIVNAIESMEAGKGILTIITRSEENKCVIEIKDNGTGMDAAAVSRLFEPYFTTKTKGNGLGLTNTQNIILNHKGSIDVASTPGKGTSFIIRFDFIS